MSAFVETARAPSVEDVARALAVPAGEVAASFRRLADGHVLVVEPDEVTIHMANPFSAVPTPFSVETGGRSYDGNRVWDGLGILAMLHADGVVRTSCPDCGESLALEVAGGELRDPTAGVIHFAVPAARWWDDIGYT